MEKLTKKALMYAENLTLPSVIEVTANMGCTLCQRRVGHIVSKMTGLTEYTVDVRNKQVIIKGDVRFQCNTRNDGLKSKTKRSTNLLSFLINCFRATTLLNCCVIELEPSILC
ncbi:uncharacterized protein LOC132302345 isoform X2 [Cornus florida]|uniref:uncharacterized protein LOC132302345 isoform X2 n=1 Tax=Cornus florida TaxID=4283 RepID=UPI00289F4B56|nr:uncharacterized protein LOC132302345 isoform X2 [Cornus florida]